MGILFCYAKQTDDEDEKENEQQHLFANTYRGNRNKMNQRHGYGIYYYDNGDSYEGDWKNDELHGTGVYKFKDGRVLNGYFECDKFVGTEPTKSLKKEMAKIKTDIPKTKPAKKIIIDDDGLINDIQHSKTPNAQVKHQKNSGDAGTSIPHQNQKTRVVSDAHIERLLREEERRIQKEHKDREKRELNKQKREQIKVKYGLR